MCLDIVRKLQNDQVHFYFEEYFVIYFIQFINIDAHNVNNTRRTDPYGRIHLPFSCFITSSSSIQHIPLYSYIFSSVYLDIYYVKPNKQWFDTRVTNQFNWAYKKKYGIYIWYFILSVFTWNHFYIDADNIICGEKSTWWWWHGRSCFCITESHGASYFQILPRIFATFRLWKC